MLNTEYRLYDPRLAQWLTRDPVFQPWESPYSAMAGNPILFSDPQGLDEITPQAEAEGSGGAGTNQGQSKDQSSSNNQVKPKSTRSGNKTSENRNTQNNGSTSNTKPIEISHVAPKSVQTSFVGIVAPLAILPMVVTVAEGVIVIGVMWYIVDQILNPRPKYVDNPSALPKTKPRREPDRVPNPVPSYEPEEDDEPEFIVRAGNGGHVNCTPRPNDIVDDKGKPNNGGLSAWRTLEIALVKHPNEKQFVYLSVAELRNDGFIVWEDNKITKHWTIRRMSEIEMQEWAATREIVKQDDSQAHPFARAVRAAIINKVSRDGTSKSTSNNDR